MSGKLQGKTAVVTGAGGNLCSVMAIDLARQGAYVALLGRTLEKLEKVQTAIAAEGGTAHCFALDVTDESAVTQAGQQLLEQAAPCSVLINGAGGNHREVLTTTNEFTQAELTGEPDVRGFFNIDPAIFLRVIEINTLGTVIPCQIFGRQMAEHGGGSVVNIASMNSYTPLTRNAAYAAGKAGVENFTRWLASYLAPANIRVNGIAPGFFPREGAKGILSDGEGELTPRGESVVGNTPQRRFGKAWELLGCMNWLIDDEASSFVNGVTIPVDGGFVANSPV